jgi:flavin-dependent dehydrogenase
MIAPEKHEVIVVGGGPAGSTCASRLAMAGHDVVLLEKAKFPREHVGESLLPFCYNLFNELGLLDELKKRFVRKAGVRFLDGRKGTISTTWCFKHVINDPSYLSFQVARAEFDQVLLDNSRRLGAKVHEETKVKDIDIQSAPDSVTVRAEDAQGNEKVYTARFVIDCTGREAFLGTKHSWRRLREEHDRTAVWSHWEDVKMAGGLEEGLSLILYMGEEQKGWIWIFPLSATRITAGFVAQNSYIRDQRKKFVDAGSKDWEYDLCMQELTKSPFVKELLDGTRLAMPMQINGNYSYEIKNHYGSNYAMVGDARGFVDPIFSSGVFLSTKSAFLVTDALHKQLIGETNGENPHMVKAYELITGAYNFVHRMIRLFYNPHALTWAEVGADGETHRRHENAMAAGHYMLSGDFFENYSKYDDFFKALENADNFRRYKKTVIDREDFQRECETKWGDIFGEVEQHRASEEASPA